MKTNTFVKPKKYKSFKKIGLFSWIISILLFFIILAMVVNPEKYISVTTNSIFIWVSVMLPSVFPFVIYTKLLTGLGLVDSICKLLNPVMKLIFNTDGYSSYIFIMSLLSGYPVGAKLTTDLYLQGKIERGSAQRTVCFTTNCGPMFLIGTIGVGFFLSKEIGYMLFLAHTLGSILNGILYRKYHKNDHKVIEQNTSLEQASTESFLASSALNSASAMFIVGTYIVVFFILIEFLGHLFSINSSSTFGAIFNGILEITHGCKDISELTSISLNLKVILANFILSFGGIATSLQVFAFIKRIDFSFKFFILQKITHAVFSTGIICVFLLLF